MSAALAEAPAREAELSAEPEPFVVCAVPIRSRAWAVPLLHAALAGQARPPEILFFVEGDSNDGTAAAIAGLAARERRRKRRPRVFGHCFITGSPHWSRDRPGEKYTGDQHASLARTYNECINRALRNWPRATHVWLLDSDVIPDPDVLALLLAAEKDVVAAAVRNSPGALNFMAGHDEGGPFRNGNESRLLAWRWSEPFEATFVSACVLYRREVLQEHRSKVPYCRFMPDPRSMDFGMMWTLRANEIHCFVEPRARCSHYYHGEGKEPLRP